jgi:hypothetical protein
MDKKRYDMLKDMGEVTNLINTMPIRLGRFKKNDKITETLVRAMMTDICYMIFFGNFRDDIKMDIHSIGKVASLFHSYFPQKVDLWHSTYLMDYFNEDGKLPDKYKENHNEIYYKFGGSQRNYFDMQELLMCIEVNCCY